MRRYGLAIFVAVVALFIVPPLAASSCAYSCMSCPLWNYQYSCGRYTATRDNCLAQAVDDWQRDECWSFWCDGLEESYDYYCTSNPCAPSDSGCLAAQKTHGHKAH